MSRVSLVCLSLSRRSGLSSCANSHPERALSAFWQIQPTRAPTSSSKSWRNPPRALGLRLHVLKASTESELESVFASLVKLGISALLVAQEPSYLRWRERIAALAASHAVPATYGQREFATAGGLMSYDASVADSFRQVGVYVGRILKGEKPADLPIMQPTKFELVLNLKTAKALGLQV